MASEIIYRQYIGESDLPHVMALVQNELSEPPHLSFLAYPSDPSNSDPIGVIVCKQSMHRDTYNRGYIAMLSVSKSWRKRGIARSFGALSMLMKEDGVEEIVLETEYDNHAALSLYESLGFIREKRLYRFYLNGKDAFRLILNVPPSDNVTPGKVRRGNVYGAIQVSDYTDDEDDDDSSVSER
ncbi:acyl-CoA N-acyltransferase [Armillaria mellea]|nr:acyl-CoA N-acyltransferase [Armillaria mellea]